MTEFETCASRARHRRLEGTLMDHKSDPIPLLWRRLRGDEAHLSRHRSRLRSAFDEALRPLAPCEEHVPRRRAAAASGRG